MQENDESIRLNQIKIESKFNVDLSFEIASNTFYYLNNKNCWHCCSLLSIKWVTLILWFSLAVNIENLLLYYRQHFIHVKYGGTFVQTLHKTVSIRLCKSDEAQNRTNRLQSENFKIIYQKMQRLGNTSGYALLLLVYITQKCAFAWNICLRAGTVSDFYE